MNAAQGVAPRDDAKRQASLSVKYKTGPHILVDAGPAVDRRDTAQTPHSRP